MQEIFTEITDYADTKANKTQEDWVAPTLLNSWVNDGGYVLAGYFKDSFGLVHLKGVIKNGTISATIFTLPVGYRPSNTVLFMTLSNNAVGRISIASSGVVVLDNGQNQFISLDGLCFRVGE